MRAGCDSDRHGCSSLHNMPLSQGQHLYFLQSMPNLVLNGFSVHDLFLPPACSAGSALIGSKAPFRLMSDHVRCGRLEAATSSVRDWWVADVLAPPGADNVQAACLKSQPHAHQ